MFEKASRIKLRFATPAGLISTEDLWDLPLTSKVGAANLDDLAKGLNRKIGDNEESFVDKPAKTNTTDQLAFDIVKRIIEVRLEEREAAKTARDKAVRKQKILGILADKKDEALKSMDVADLEKLLEE
jgi:hypothetical protein